MGKVRKYIIRNCSVCDKEIQIRSDYIKKHKGMCRSCVVKNTWKNEDYKKMQVNKFLGKKQSKETITKRSLSLLGRKRPDEVKKRISQSNKGKKRSPEYLIRLSKRMKGKQNLKGFKFSKESRKRMSDSHKTEEHINKYYGKNKYNWKGRPRTLRYNIRISPRYLQWRSDVFKRDNWTCQTCQKRGKVEAHHIITFSRIMDDYSIRTYEDGMKCEALWDIDNGVSLCFDCHLLTRRKKR